MVLSLSFLLTLIVVLSLSFLLTLTVVLSLSFLANLDYSLTLVMVLSLLANPDYSLTLTVNQARSLVQLRAKLIAAIDSGALAATESEWVEVDAALTLCHDATQTLWRVPRRLLSGCAPTGALIQPCPTLIQPHPTLSGCAPTGAAGGAAASNEDGFCGDDVVAELACVARELGYRGDVDDVMAKLEAAIGSLFEAALETALGQAAMLRMHEHGDGTVQACVKDAVGFLAAVRHAKVSHATSSDTTTRR